MKGLNPRRSKSYKLRLLHLQDHRCWLCGTRRSYRTFTLDHINPRCLGGGNSFTNFKLACEKCNNDRGNAFRRLLKPKYYLKLTLDKSPNL